jgi:hypothetical protein
MRRLGISVAASMVVSGCAFGQWSQGEASFGELKYLSPAIKGAPYSGELVREMSSADPNSGATPATKTIEKEWRDSQGRVRTEEKIGPLVEIRDPVEMYISIVDNANHIVHRVPAEISPQRAKAAAGRGSRVGVMRRPNEDVTTEDLGSKTIAGLVAKGTRTTRANLATARTSVQETWRSAELQLVLLTTTIEDSTGPRPERATRKIINLSRDEPDPSLFTVPPDYPIVPETGTFSIKWGGQ